MKPSEAKYISVRVSEELLRRIGVKIDTKKYEELLLSVKKHDFRGWANSAKICILNKNEFIIKNASCL